MMTVSGFSNQAEAERAAARYRDHGYSVTILTHTSQHAGSFVQLRCTPIKGR